MKLITTGGAQSQLAQYALASGKFFVPCILLNATTDLNSNLGQEFGRYHTS